MPTIPSRPRERAALDDLVTYLTALADALDTPTTAALDDVTRDYRDFNARVAQVRVLATDARRALVASRREA